MKKVFYGLFFFFLLGPWGWKAPMFMSAGQRAFTMGWGICSGATLFFATLVGVLEWVSWLVEWSSPVILSLLKGALQ